MGVFINQLKGVYDLTSETIDKLDRILTTRNYLAHKYFKLHIEKFYSQLGMIEMLEYFCEFIDNSNELTLELDAYYLKYKQKIGLTEEKIQEMMKEMEENEVRRAQQTQPD